MKHSFKVLLFRSRRDGADIVTKSQDTVAEFAAFRSGTRLLILSCYIYCFETQLGSMNKRCSYTSHNGMKCKAGLHIVEDEIVKFV